MEMGRPLLPADALIPKFVSVWNIQKGPIDDMSHDLSTCLPRHLEQSPEFVGFGQGCFWWRSIVDGDYTQ